MHDELDRAAEALSCGRIDDATAIYTGLIDRDEPSVPALLGRGAIHSQRGALAAAEADYTQAAALAPHDPVPKMRLGQLAWTMARNIAAAEFMEAALACPPHPDEMRVNAAHCYDMLDWLDLGYRAVKPLPAALPDWWAGAAQRSRSRYGEEHARALAVLRGRRASSDPNATGWNLANHFYHLGRLSPAKRLCEALMRDRPTSFPAFHLYTRIVAREQGAAAAIAFLEALSWLHRTTPEHAVTLAHYLMEAGRFEEVLEVTARLALDQEPEDLRYRKTVALLALGRTAELRHYCRAWMALAPESTQPAGFITAAPWDPDELQRDPSPSPAAIARPHIMQFWDKTPIPDDIADTMKSWTDAHPGVEHTVYDEDAARGFLAARFGTRATETWDRCHHIAMKVDYFRLAFLHEAGGLYVDADELCLRPLGSLLALGGEAEIIACLSGEVPGYLHNWFLGARAGSRIMRAAMQDIEIAIERHTAEGRKPDIWQVTGPGLVTRATARFLTEPPSADTGPVTLLPLQRYRSLARTNHDLVYKRSSDQNWQLA